MLDYTDNRSILGEFESQFFGESKSSHRSLLFLMPTGLMVRLSVDKRQTFSETKNQLWRQVGDMPAYDNLYLSTRYVFNCYNNRLEKEEIFDETMKIQDFKIFRSMILVVERIGDRDEKLFNVRMGSIICLPIFKIQNMNGKEEKDFRRNIHAMCEEVVNERKNETILQRMEEVYPPVLVSEGIALSNDILESSTDIKLDIYFSRGSNPTKYPNAFIIDRGESSPTQIIQSALHHWYQVEEIGVHEYDAGLYFLKVAGAEEYLYGNHQIIYFKYVQKCLADRKMVKLIVVKQASLQKVLAYEGFKKCSSLRGPDRDTENLSYDVRDLWEIPGKFSITVGKANNVLGEDGAQYFVKMCLYHGGEPLVAGVKTQPLGGAPIRVPEWNELVHFGIDIADLPRNVRLCCVLYAVTKRKRSTQSIAWVNIPLFDYRGMLKCGTVKLPMWDCNAADESFNYIGTTTSNSRDECITLTLQFPPNISNVRYPDKEQICSLSNDLLEKSKESSERDIERFGLEKVKGDDKIVFCMSPITDPPANYIQSLHRIVNKNPLEDIYEQEKTLLWQMRVYCQTELKNSLPKLLRSFEWSDHKKVATMKQMVIAWQPLDPEYALELLDYQYPDMSVRDFAVKCLENLSDQELGRYLLQLVQVLKYESYLDNSLTRFLLKRSIKNSRIGHDFFWHLRSEMHQKELITRFGLILEAYCRSNTTRTEQLEAQHDALELLHNAAKKAKEEKKFSEGTADDQSSVLVAVRKTLDKGNKTLKPYLAASMPSVKVNTIVVEKCSVMNSKKKPLRITCKNEDSLGSDLVEMYKAGDDLRQDCLTLQTIGLMDELWQNHGMDLKLNVYGCISTGENIGLICPVLKSFTLAAIQRRHGGAFNRHTLYNWIKEQSKTDQALEEAISNFTKSCAAYCVATYILGIGDRHSDNIMITETGKLFHIDFGHFLGNYKSFNRAGIAFRRERVPMIMLSDFIYIITKGKHDSWRDAKDDIHFKTFMEMCLTAFKIIRNKSTLFINLFALMCSTGIPELSSIDDLRYLKVALGLDMSEEEAKEHFRKKMLEALKNETSAKLNFWIHNLAQK